MKAMYINYVYFILYLSKWCYNCTCVLLYAKSSVEYFSPSLLSYRQRGHQVGRGDTGQLVVTKGKSRMEEGYTRNLERTDTHHSI